MREESVKYKNKKKKIRYFSFQMVAIMETGCNIYLYVPWLTSWHDSARGYDVYVPGDYKSSQFKRTGNVKDDARGAAPSSRGVSPFNPLGLGCLSSPVAILVYMRASECVRVFFVASYLHHDSASNCSSAHTLKCLESYFKLDNVLKFSGFLYICFYQLYERCCSRISRERLCKLWAIRSGLL